MSFKTIAKEAAIVLVIVAVAMRIPAVRSIVIPA